MAIDASPTSPTMNAYCDLTFADAYFAFRFGAEAWTDFDESTKEALIVRATNKLDTLEYGGLKADRNQPLQWPRQLIYDNEGNSYASDVVPTKVKQATCEMAYWLWTEEDRFFSDTDLGQIESYSAGPLDVKAKKGAATWPDEAMTLLRSVGKGTVLGTNSGAGAQTMRIML